MKLLLRSDVDGLGRRGDIVDVADGYGRNFLLPRGVAMLATDSMEDQAAAMRRRRTERNAADRSVAEEIATQLVPMVITVRAKASPEGRLFGSVGAAELAAAVAEQSGIELDRKAIGNEHVKELGTHLFMVQLHPEVQFPVTFEVVAE